MNKSDGAAGRDPIDTYRGPSEWDQGKRKAELCKLMREIALSPTGAALATAITSKLGGVASPHAADIWAVSVCDYARALLETTVKVGRL